MDNTESNDDNTENNKNILKSRGKKRKRKGSNSSSESEEDVLPENALEVEHNLIASAVKNNLDDVSVKKILKKVVTNDHVLALVKLREEEEESSKEQNGVAPKLTRAKVKELMKVSRNTAPWNLEKIELTPIKHIPVKTRPEVKALIAQELPEDEDDDEYEPTHDDVPSDDDQGLESCSDIDSQPRTPATPNSVSKISPKVVKDGPFKVPQDVSTPTRRKLDMDEEEATIALRTRSKLCLSETPIEHIESSFVPPDEPVPPVVDHLWNEFLNECLNPASVSRNEDDDEADPEYNVAADPDAHEEDEEALERTIIKISKKELNDLVTELFNIMPETTVEDELTVINSVIVDQDYNKSTAQWDGKQEPLSDEERPLKISESLSGERRNSFNNISIGKTEPMEEDPLAIDGTEPQGETHDTRPEGLEKVRVIGSTVVHLAVEEKMMGVQPPPTTVQAPTLLLQLQPANQASQVTIHTGPVILPDQILILQQQLRQHIQIATTNFLQLFVNPLHWAMAPTYKEYLEAFKKMVDTDPSSVAGVCNLLPALELVQQWEETVAKDTPENTAMVNFIQKQAERWRRNSANNKLYVGDFHDTFMKVVANSAVFLYPHLLPPMPYGADQRRRYAYMRSEDELITIGLDQFWQYVESNPDLFRQPARSHPRHRWGLSATVELVLKHMFPWQQQRALMHHIMTMRRSRDSDNPITKYFASGEVTPVKHKLLQFNPKLTLYEQPEHEMPRIWIKYLARTSKRFKIYLRRRENVLGQTPTGVDINVESPAQLPPKAPLPIDFTKEIRIPKINPQTPAQTPHLADKIDINIEKEPQEKPQLNFFQLVQTSDGATLVPLVMQTQTNTQQVTLLPKPTLQIDNLNISVVPTKTNDETNTVDSNVSPITSTIEVNNEKTSQKIDEEEHCSCCVLLKKICKSKQTVITDYFKFKNKDVNKTICKCNENKYPPITKRLRLLVKRYRSHSKLLYEKIQKKLNIRKSVNDEECARLNEDTESYTLEDLVFVTAFQLKLTLRASLAKNVFIKSRLVSLFSKFDLDTDDPLFLAFELEKLFSADLVDIGKEFIGFLNPEQADRINSFKDYFIQNIAEDLVKKIEEQVRDEVVKHKLYRQMSAFFAGRQWSPCYICGALLTLMSAQPKLATYTFHMFPHANRRRKTVVASTNTATPTTATTLSNIANKSEPVPAQTEENIDDDVTQIKANSENEADCDARNSVDDDIRSGVKNENRSGVDNESRSGVVNDSGSGVDNESCSNEEPMNGGRESPTCKNYEADHSDNSEDDTESTTSIPPDALNSQPSEVVIKMEPQASATSDTTGITISKTIVQEYRESEVYMTLVMSEDEYVKPEPLEWKRAEDKLILEMLKHHLTPEERKDKPILELIEEKQIVQLLAESLTDKSFGDIKERVMNILKLLVKGDL